MIYLMRHGEDDERFIGGWSDIPLTPKGIKESIIASLWLAKNVNITNIIASDIERAKETSLIVSNIIHVPVSYDTHLREQNKGLINGLEKEMAIKKYPEYFQNVRVDTVYPEGESLKNLYERIKEYYLTMASIEDNTLIVTHRGVINMLYYLTQNKELDMNKEQFGVVHSSIHEFNKEKKLIRRIW